MTIRLLIHEKGLNQEGLRRLLGTIPCWEIGACGEERAAGCPAYQNMGVPCWELAAKRGVENGRNCYQCPVYLSAPQRICTPDELNEIELVDGDGKALEVVPHSAKVGKPIAVTTDGNVNVMTACGQTPMTLALGTSVAGLFDRTVPQVETAELLLDFAGQADLDALMFRSHRQGYHGDGSAAPQRHANVERDRGHDRFPRLTEIGAWRRETMVEMNFDPYVGDGIRHGGFYTKADVAEIVAYAAARYVTVIPEIEMPGHSQAALAAYQLAVRGPTEAGRPRIPTR